MANIFDTSGSVAPVTQNQTPIQQGIVDPTAATTVAAVGSLAKKAGGDIVSAKAVSDAQNILKNPEQIDVPEIEPYMKRLGDIADGVKAGMQRQKAQIMARATMAEAINQHPYYAKEIRERGATLFGIGSSSTMGGKANVQQTPEQKAFDDYRQAVTQTQLTYGVSQGTAEQMYQRQKDAEVRKITAQDFTDDIYVGVNDATVKMQDEVFKGITQSPTGTLSPEQVRGYSMSIDRSAIQLQRTLMAAATKRGAVTADTFKLIDDQVKQYKMNMKTFVTDQAMTKWMTANNDLAAQMITAWGNQNYGGLMLLAKNQLLPDSVKELILKSQTGDAKAKALIQSNPYLKGILSNTADLGMALRSAYAMTINSIYGGSDPSDEERNTFKVTEQQQAASTALALHGKGGSKFNKALLDDTQGQAQHQIDLSLKYAPEGITRWAQPAYAATFPETQRTQTIDHEMGVVAKSLRAHMYSIVDDQAQFNTLSIESAERAIPKSVRYSQGALGALPAQVIVGDGLDQYGRSRILDMLKVARKFPEVWEGKAQDAEEYVERLIKDPNSMNELRRNKANNLGTDMDSGVNKTTETAKTDTSAAAQDEELTAKVQAIKNKGYTLDQILEVFDSLGFGGGSTGDVRKAIETAYNA